MPTGQTRRRVQRRFVFVAELKPEAAQRKSVRVRNPERDPAARCVYVGVTVGQHPTVRYPSGDFTASRNRMLRTYGVRLLPDFRTRHWRAEGALRSQQDFIKDLRSCGWTVVNAEPRQTCSVYVVELAQAVLQSARVLEENPDCERSLPPVYVGRTSKTPEERFRQHKRGEHASRHVRDHGLALIPELYEHLNPLTPLDSYRQERHLAWKLRRAGYTVLGGH